MHDALAEKDAIIKAQKELIADALEAIMLVMMIEKPTPEDGVAVMAVLMKIKKHLQ